MKPIGKYILIQEINEEYKTKSGLLLSNEDINSLRYHKAKVFKVGDHVDTMKEGDVIYYDNAAGHKMIIDDTTYTIIQERDVVVVL